MHTPDPLDPIILRALGDSVAITGPEGGDAHQFAHWAGETPEGQGVIAGLSTSIRSDVDAETAEHREEVIGRLMKRVAAETSSIRPHQQIAQRKVPLGATPKWRAAGLVTGMLALGVALWMIVPKASSNIRSMEQEYTTMRGQRATFDLPDGSRMVLAPESKARFSQTASGSSSVELSGQAYFSISHDPSRAFIVRSGDLVTQVLGTSFVVRAYPEDKVQRVAVTEGKVSIAADQQSAGGSANGVILLPGDIGDLERGSLQPVIRTDVVVSDIVGWMRGQLRFDKTRLRDMIVELRRAYDVDIQVPNPTLANQPVTMMFSGESLNEVLRAITLATDSRVHRDDRGRIMLIPN